MISDRIKLLREKKGLSQYDLAVLVNVAQSSIGNYERGSRIPDSNTIIALANCFDVSTDYLLGLTDDPKRLPTAADTIGLSQEAVDMLTAWNTQCDKRPFRDGHAGLSVLSRLITYADFLHVLALVQSLLNFSASNGSLKYTKEDISQALAEELKSHGYQPVPNSIFRKSTITQIGDRFGVIVSHLAEIDEAKAAEQYCTAHGLEYRKAILADAIQAGIDADFYIDNLKSREVK